MNAVTAGPRHMLAGLIVLTLAACAGSPASPQDPGPQMPAPTGVDRAAVIAALEYWREAAGITFTLVEASDEPRILIRTGTDGLAPQGGGRAVVDGTYQDNRARSGLVVFEPGGGQYCGASGTAAPWCRYLYRHEIGHALGFLTHSAGGLMLSTPDALTSRERAMIVALYTLPHGAVVAADGRWTSPSGSGTFTDVQAAQDIMAWNMNAPSSTAYRREGVITRWDLPVRVYIQP